MGLERKVRENLCLAGHGVLCGDVADKPKERKDLMPRLGN